MVNCAEVRDRLVGLLCRPSVANLTWWDEAELFRAMDSEAQAIARRAELMGGVFTGALSANVGEYAVAPSRPIRLKQAQVNGRVLTKTPLMNLQALTPNWQNWTSSVPERVTEEGVPSGSMRVVPKPDASGAVLRTFALYSPAEVTSGAPSLNFPDWLHDAILLGAYARLTVDDKGGKPELAGALRMMADQLTEVARSYYGVPEETA